jgi:AcrR family transcriptional regulator
MDAIGDTLLDSALALGADRGWDALQLHEVAARAGLPLSELQGRFEGKDGLAEALFDRAEQALVGAAATPGWERLSPRECLQAALQAWFAVLAPHRALVREMLAYKLHPEHLHLQLQGLLRVSRTVQWWREAALLTESGWRRELVEAGLTAIYLGTVWRWLRDDAQALLWLERRLLQAEWMAQISKR